MDTSNSDPPLTTTTGLAAQYRRSGDGLNAPTEPTAQYQQAGKGQLSHITDAAQLTLLISRADDVDMSSAPATPRPPTTSPHHDDASEADAANALSVPRLLPRPTSGNVLHARCTDNSSRQANHLYSSGPTAAHNVLTCTPSASQVASVETTN